MHDYARLRIVEIGAAPYMKYAFPGQVEFFSTWTDGGNASPGEADGAAALPGLGALWRALNAPATSLVVCHPSFYSPWHWRWISRVLFDRHAISRLAKGSRKWGPQLLRRPIAAPVAILDHDDLPLINRNNFFLLDRCRYYFKRELPADRWRIFLKTGHADLPTPRYRRSRRNRARIGKLKPLSLGVPLSAPRPFPGFREQKNVDIFFAGAIDGSSTLRRRGHAELLALRDRGFAIDIPDRPLPQPEFYRRCAQAWLVWSPEGLGWDCFRHYEAPLCGSVPLLGLPGIERYQPLQNGEHAVYYAIEDGGLTRAAAAALADKPRLETMARAAKSHVLAHHTAEATGRYVVHTCLGVSAPSLDRSMSAPAE